MREYIKITKTKTEESEKVTKITCDCCHAVIFGEGVSILGWKLSYKEKYGLGIGSTAEGIMDCDYCSFECLQNGIKEITSTYIYNKGNNYKVDISIEACEAMNLREKEEKILARWRAKK